MRFRKSFFQTLYLFVCALQEALLHALVLLQDVAIGLDIFGSLLQLANLLLKGEQAVLVDHVVFLLLLQSSNFGCFLLH